MKQICDVRSARRSAYTALRDPMWTGGVDHVETWTCQLSMSVETSGESAETAAAKIGKARPRALAESSQRCKLSSAAHVYFNFTRENGLKLCGQSACHYIRVAMHALSCCHVSVETRIDSFISSEHHQL